jgi:predicted RNA-binding Zn-ribbon protein involved in translation (DUF1610 family)
MPVHVPIGAKYAATSTEMVRTDFVCEKCGHRAPVEVVASGTAIKEAPFFLFRKSAADAAVAEAPEVAKRNALNFTRLYPCPKCGKRQTKAVMVLILGEAVIGALIALPVWLVGMFVGLVAFCTKDGPAYPMYLTGFALAFLTIALVVRRGYVKTTRLAQIAVEFLEAGEEGSK